MATIDYKEKYEQAMERARQFIEKPYLEDSAGIVRYIFPELRESEDERIRKWIIDDIRYKMNNEPLNNSVYKKNAEKAIDWLEKQAEQKLVEDRYMEGYLNGINDTLKSAAWSEEDMNRINHIISFMEDKDRVKDTERLFPIEEDVRWLKSLRLQSQWKPSDEQMEYLAKAIATLGDEGNCKTASILNDLRVELKKLRGE